MKKKEKLLRSFGELDDRYIEEADPQKKKKRRPYAAISAAAAFAVLLTSLSLWLFIPFNTEPPIMSEYADSEYYPLIQKLSDATYTPPKYHNNYQLFVQSVDDIVTTLTGGATMDESLNFSGNEPTADADGTQQYVEVTDNQVAGVIEGDILKRTEDRAFYLHGDLLTVYSIEGEESRELGSYKIYPFSDAAGYYFYNLGEMYLSSDGNTVTFVLPYSINSKGAFTALITLDVSDPENIKQTNLVNITGSYRSSRNTDGKLLLLTEFYVGNNPDFSDESTFLPQIECDGEPKSIPMSNIVFPEEISTTRYTTICSFDQATLELCDSFAFLSYSNVIYVSRDSVYVTRQFYTDKTAAEGYTYSYSQSEISRLDYSGESFEFKGSVTVNGTLKDQYSLDEFDGILRAVTTTENTVYRSQSIDNVNYEIASFPKSNADLYCIDIESMETVASVISFAPEGERVQSVRFDGYSAYVCTSIKLSDPVFFFDLSDLSNITAKDTGTIDGFSTSLINLGDGFLLGIGVGGSWDEFKVEVYEENGDKVTSVCAYTEKNTTYSTEYKSYLIDRESNLIGLAIDRYNTGTANYLLLHFDNYDLHQVVDLPIEIGYSNISKCRAFIADNYLYIFAGNSFNAVPLN